MDKLLDLTPKGILLAVKVAPNAKRNAFCGVLDEKILKISLQAPALEDKANQALVDFLSKEWNLKKKEITIIYGRTSHNKILLITKKELYEWLKQKLLMENKSQKS